MTRRPPPTSRDLIDFINEVGWAIERMCKDLLHAVAQSRKQNSDLAQAAYDGALLHVRTLVEFLTDNDASKIQASDYVPGWNGKTEANRMGYDINQLRIDLNNHAAHLSRLRLTAPPPKPWELIDHADQLLSLFLHLLRSSGVTSKQELYNHVALAQADLERTILPLHNTVRYRAVAIISRAQPSS